MRKNLLNRLAQTTGQNSVLCREAVDVIKRQRTEIEKLKSTLSTMGVDPGSVLKNGKE